MSKWEPTPENMFTDVAKQGFMKIGKEIEKWEKKQEREKKKAEKLAARPIVNCEKCKSWHRKGKHFPLVQGAS